MKDDEPAQEVKHAVDLGACHREKKEALMELHEIAQCALNLCLAAFAIVTCRIGRAQNRRLGELERKLGDCEKQGSHCASRLDG